MLPVDCQIRSTRPRWPWSFSLFCGGLHRLPAGHGLGACGNRLDDVVVAGAATDIALELLPNRVLVEARALAVDDVDGGHDHSGGAEPTLQAVMLAKSLLHRVELSVERDSLDGRYR